ncbi:class I SAM-dependent methyltransferase [uncultured Maribacter sp.]|uniref:class I SAM-dependent methyltransferase n=1 Tax=uncultured Maribacter sp. TaxID=431308 RepID=UPI0030D92A63|tara:strand:+ start:2639 stop:3364 length:726 start_codon:yes stop_codon:yes gene_type:complete
MLSRFKSTRIPVVIGLLLICSCNGQTKASTEDYVFKKGDRNGIGKWYMDREIAHVMGFQGMNWLERPEREEEENASILLKNMDIKPTDIIADIGAGSGYHVFRMAPLVSRGSIYAVDIQDEMLEALEAKKETQNIHYIKIIKGSEKSVNLPENSVDKVLMVDVYHEFNYPKEIIASIKKALNPKGKLFLIEYRGEDRTVPIKELHKMTEAQTVKEMETAGLTLERNDDNLPWQHCMVFIKN